MTASTLYPATIKRSPRGRLAVTVANMELGEDPNLAVAVHRLCNYAIRHSLNIVVTITTGAGVRYMSIDTEGVAAACSAPAAAIDVSDLPEIDSEQANLGTSETDFHTTGDFVEKYILDPSAGAPPPPQKKRRFGFGRREA